MLKKYMYQMLAVILAAAGGIALTFVQGNEPLLGLDLQGGVSVVLQPTEEASDVQLENAIKVLRERVDQIGVAEPEVSAQGQNIVVGLPGLVEDQQDALDRLSQTAELRFRPVVADLGNPFASMSEEELAEFFEAQGGSVEIEGTADDQETSEDEDAEENTELESSEEAEDGETSLGGTVKPVSFLYQEAEVESESDPTEDVDDEVSEEDQQIIDDLLDQVDELDLEAELDDSSEAETDPSVQADLTGLAANCGTEATPIEDIEADDFVVLSDEFGNLVCLGPTLFTGDVLEGALATTDLGGHSGAVGTAPWSVNLTLKPGAQGIDLFNEAAAACFSGDPTLCPVTSEGRGRLAAVLDFTIISAPTINAPDFDRDRINISGSFGEVEAKNVAEALNFGALPLELEAQEIRTVSAAIGGDVLEAGVISGLIGLFLVALYLLYYYRLAGLVAIGGLGLSAMLLWTVVSWLGESYGLALSIAGVVGLIVSIGVSTDSNIVYFENVKEAFRSGTKASTSVERAYQTSISTIIKADVVSLIAAVLLYFLAVGAVRGFALFLGLATMLDLIISIMFMRPALVAISRTGLVKRNPRLMGIRNIPKDVSNEGSVR